MVNLAHHETIFWDTLHAKTTGNSSIDLRRELLGQQRVFALPPGVKVKSGDNAETVGYTTDNIPTGLLADNDRVKIDKIKMLMDSNALVRDSSYDFLNDSGFGNTAFLPLFEDSGEDSGTTSLGTHDICSSEDRRSQKDADTVTPEAQDSAPSEHATKKEAVKRGASVPSKMPKMRSSSNGASSDDSTTGDNPSTQPLRRGLRARKQPKQYKMEQSDGSDGEQTRKRKRGRARNSSSSGSKPRGTAKRPQQPSGPPVVVRSEAGVEIVSDRVERPLPPDLDEKSRRRILRNRASAERSRLKRLGQIAMLEQENQSLRNQLDQARQDAARGQDWVQAWGGSSMNERVLMEENTALKAEGRLLSERVRTLTSLLQASRGAGRR